MKQKHFINSHKDILFLVILLRMAYFNQWQKTIVRAYLALHDTHGILWGLQSRIFPDAQRKKNINARAGCSSHTFFSGAR